MSSSFSLLDETIEKSIFGFCAYAFGLPNVLWMKNRSNSIFFFCQIINFYASNSCVDLSNYLSPRPIIQNNVIISDDEI